MPTKSAVGCTIRSSETTIPQSKQIRKQEEEQKNNNTQTNKSQAHKN